MKRTLLLALLAPLLAGCLFSPRASGSNSTPEPSPTPSAFVLALGDGVQLAVLGNDTTWNTTADHDCAGELHRLTTSTGDYQVALLRSDCTGEPRALNGFHGYFTEPPAGVEVATAQTPIGPAQVFSNTYTECTNSCASGTDEVALVAVGTRTLQVIAPARVSRDDRTRDRAQLVGLLQGLSKA
jgi:hypothetical protein